MGDFPFGGIPGLQRQAATPVAGVALVNGTPNILTWTAPNDGLMHRALIFAALHVTSLETGGQVNATLNLPDGLLQSNVLFFGSQAAGGYSPPAAPYPWQLALIEANSTITIQQGTALTGGAAVVWAEIWGS